VNAQIDEMKFITKVIFFHVLVSFPVSTNHIMSLFFQSLCNMRAYKTT